jgi:HAD superfamily hydrolase (TIGR01490 family)
VTVAFFDLDRTLLSKNSGSLWIRQEFKAGRIGLGTAMKAAIWLTRYHLGQANIESALDQAVARLQGVSEAELTARTLDFYQEHISQLYRPGALAAVAEHREAGDKLVLLTTSSLYLSQAVKETLQFDAILCNRFEVDISGNYTGKLCRPVCYGEGKLTHALAHLENDGVAIKDCFFYTDSVSDLPVLEAVGKPRVVAPDRKLRAIAQRRGWPVLNW